MRLAGQPSPLAWYEVWLGTIGDVFPNGRAARGTRGIGKYHLVGVDDGSIFHPNFKGCDPFTQDSNFLPKPIFLSRQAHVGPGKQDYEGSSQNRHSLLSHVLLHSESPNPTSGRIPCQAPENGLGAILSESRGVPGV